MIITICSSISFTKQILQIKQKLQELGHEVLIPYMSELVERGEVQLEDFEKEKSSNGDLKYREDASEDLIKRHASKILKSDSILVLNFEKNGEGGYIGGNTLIEMGIAYTNEIPIYMYNELPKKSQRIHYLDEIASMKPIIINQDLSKYF